MTCAAYERDVSACLGYLQGEGIQEFAEVKVTHLRVFLASEQNWISGYLVTLPLILARTTNPERTGHRLGQSRSHDPTSPPPIDPQSPRSKADEP